MALKTTYVDDVLDTSKNTLRKYNMIQNSDGTVSFVDVTDYKTVGDSFGSADVNAQNKEINNISSQNVNFANKFDELNSSLDSILPAFAGCNQNSLGFSIGTSVKYLTSAFSEYNTIGDNSATAQANGVKISKTGCYNIHLIVLAYADDVEVGIGIRKYVSATEYADNVQYTKAGNGTHIHYLRISESIEAGTLIRPICIGKTASGTINTVNLHVEKCFSI